MEEMVKASNLGQVIKATRWKTIDNLSMTPSLGHTVPGCMGENVLFNAFCVVKSRPAYNLKINPASSCGKKIQNNVIWNIYKYTVYIKFLRSRIQIHWYEFINRVHGYSSTDTTLGYYRSTDLDPKVQKSMLTCLAALTGSWIRSSYLTTPSFVG